MVYVLIFVEVLFIFLAWYSFGWRILSPTFITTIVIFISTICAALSADAWDMEISGKTFLTIAIGFLMMYLAELLAYKSIKPSSHQLSSLKLLQLPK